MISEQLAALETLSLCVPTCLVYCVFQLYHKSLLWFIDQFFSLSTKRSHDLLKILKKTRGGSAFSHK